VSPAKLVEKLIKRAAFRKKVAEMMKGKVDADFDTFSEKVKDRAGEAVEKLLGKAKEEGITVGEYKPDTIEEAVEEAFPVLRRL